MRRIRIIAVVPVHKEHGIRRGRIFEAIIKNRQISVMGDQGEEVRLWIRHFEYLRDPEMITSE